MFLVEEFDYTAVDCPDPQGLSRRISAFVHPKSKIFIALQQAVQPNQESHFILVRRLEAENRLSHIMCMTFHNLDEAIGALNEIHSSGLAAEMEVVDTQYETMDLARIRNVMLQCVRISKKYNPCINAVQMVLCQVEGIVETARR